jgi:phosphate transport system permease protein
MNSARAATMTWDRIFHALCTLCLVLPLACGTWFVVDTVTRGAPLLLDLVRSSDVAFVEVWVHARLVGFGACIAIPVGIGAAVYLEQPARPGTFTRIAERSISLLAAIPSVLYGICGLTLLVVCLGVQSTFVTKTVCLALFLFPIVVERARVALRTVSPQIREASLVLGADPLRTLVHVTLPLSLPVLASELFVVLARAFGTVAPLLVVDVFTPQPKIEFPMPLFVRIFRSGTDPDPSRQSLASAATLMLLGLLIVMHVAGRRLANRRKTTAISQVRDGLSERGAS